MDTFDNFMVASQIESILNNLNRIYLGEPCKIFGRMVAIGSYDSANTFLDFIDHCPFWKFLREAVTRWQFYVVFALADKLEAISPLIAIEWVNNNPRFAYLLLNTKNEKGEIKESLYFTGLGLTNDWEVAHAFVESPEEDDEVEYTFYEAAKEEHINKYVEVFRRYFPPTNYFADSMLWHVDRIIESVITQGGGY